MRVWYVGVRVMLVTPSVGSMQMCKDEQQRARMQHSIESASGHLLLGDSLAAQRLALPSRSRHSHTNVLQRVVSPTGCTRPSRQAAPDEGSHTDQRPEPRRRSGKKEEAGDRHRRTEEGSRRPAAAARRREERSDYEAMGRLVTSSSMGGGDVTRT